MNHIAQMRAERARLDEKIRMAEQVEAEAWNFNLDQCRDAFVAFLGRHGLGGSRRERKNEETWDVGDGALSATFATDGEQWARGLRMTCGGSLTLEWCAVPEPAYFVAVVAALLGVEERC